MLITWFSLIIGKPIVLNNFNYLNELAVPLRNGPNPQFLPFFSYTYTFNGDGMVYMTPRLQNNYTGA